MRPKTAQLSRNWIYCLHWSFFWKWHFQQRVTFRNPCSTVESELWEFQERRFNCNRQRTLSVSVDVLPKAENIMNSFVARKQNYENSAPGESLLVCSAHKFQMLFSRGFQDNDCEPDTVLPSMMHSRLFAHKSSEQPNQLHLHSFKKSCSRRKLERCKGVFSVSAKYGNL